METDIKIVTFKNLSRMIERMEDTFASKSIEAEMINTKVSKEIPTNQTVGDLWFVETERN